MHPAQPCSLPAVWNRTTRTARFRLAFRRPWSSCGPAGRKGAQCPGWRAADPRWSHWRIHAQRPRERGHNWTTCSISVYLISRHVLICFEKGTGRSGRIAHLCPTQVRRVPQFTNDVSHPNAPPWIKDTQLLDKCQVVVCPPRHFITSKLPSKMIPARNLLSYYILSRI